VQLNVLLLPLLGGFLFLSIYSRTAYFLARQTTTTFSFWLAAAGIGLLVVARTAVMIWKFAMLGPQAVAIPALSITLIPLLAALLFAFGISTFIKVVEAGRKRQSNERWSVLRNSIFASKKEIWRLLLGLVVFGVVGYAFFATRKVLAHNLPNIVGIPIQIVWAYEFLACITLAPWWARKIHAAPVPILFRSILVGLFYLLLLELVTIYPKGVKDGWVAFAKPTASQVASEELATSVLALILGPAIALTFNCLYPRKSVQDNLMENRTTNTLDRLFYRVTKRAKMVMLTLNDGKVYCGYIDWIPADPGAVDAFLEIQPVFSGYREKDSRRARLPVNYAPFYTKLDRSEWIQFKKVIPVSSISSAGEFDPEHFDSFGTYAENNAEVPRGVATTESASAAAMGSTFMAGG
jgi:hypothetical protein